MMLHDAMRDLVRKGGRTAITKRSLADILDSEGCFDRCPSLLDAAGKMVSGGFVMELFRKSAPESPRMYLKSELKLRMAMGKDGGLRQALIDCSVRSVSFAWGLRDPVKVPFEPDFRYCDGIFHSLLFPFVMIFVFAGAGGTIIYQLFIRPDTDWNAVLVLTMFLTAIVPVLTAAREQSPEDCR
ncbi:MAG: hypothetical protein SPL25_10730 [Succinivibrionaceae bacterium]|nr:hypothetical protein [Succinivibrionaceae bacterium]